MSKTSQVAISISASGDGMSLSFTSSTQTNIASPAEQQPFTVANGNNAVAVPAGSTGVLIVPPATSTVTKTLKGINGDTGIAIAPAAAAYLPLPSGATSFVINASGAETLSLYWL